MPSKEEKFLEEGEVGGRKNKESEGHLHPLWILRCTSVVFSALQYIQRMWEEAARWSGGCDKAEGSGGFGGSGTRTHLSTQSPIVFFFKHLEKRLMTLNWQLFSSCGSITLIKRSLFSIFTTCLSAAVT